MTIIRNELLSAMKQALPGVETGSSILEGADTFIFKEGYIHSYNDTISVSTPFGSELEGAIKAKEFFDLISRFKSDELKIINREGKWIIKDGEARAELILLESSLYEHITNIKPKEPTWTVLPSNFMDGLAVCLFNANHSRLAGIYVNEAIMTSTDEIRINWFHLDSAVKEPFWLNDKSVKELLKLNNIEKYYVDRAWIHFLSKDNAMFSCKRLADESYPFQKIEIVIDGNKKNDDDICGELPKELNGAIDRASSLSISIENYNSIKLTLKEDGIEVYSERKSGNYTEKVKWDTEVNNIKEVSFFVDYMFFNQGIRNSDSFYVKDNNGTKIVFVHANGFQVVNTFIEKE